MEVNYLKKDEFQYELCLRGMPVENQLVNRMRSQLRSLLSFEASEPALHYPAYFLTHAEEIEVVTDKVSKLTVLRDSISATPNMNQHKRLRTRLVHLLKRNDRISCSV